MNSIGIRFLAGVLWVAFPLSLQAVADEHADYDSHESGQGEVHDEGSVHLTPEQQAMAGVVIEVLRPRDIVTELRAPGEIQLNAYATTRVSPRVAAAVVRRKGAAGDQALRPRSGWPGNNGQSDRGPGSQGGWHPWRGNGANCR